jgi:hypothetical protein
MQLKPLSGKLERGFLFVMFWCASFMIIGNMLIGKAVVSIASSGP